MKTYHDVFVEQLVRRERPGGEFLFRCGAVLLGLVLLAAAYVLARPFFGFFLALLVLLEFFAFVYTVKEYEYSFINGDVDVDMIQGRRRRRTLCSFSCKDVTEMAPCDGAGERMQGEFTRRLDAAVSPRAADRWYLITEREDGSRELLILSPNERLLAAFKGYLGKKMEYSLPEGNTDMAD